MLYYNMLYYITEYCYIYYILYLVIVILYLFIMATSIL